MAAQRKAGVARTSRPATCSSRTTWTRRSSQSTSIFSSSRASNNDHKVPPNETDQVQPIDRGLGRQVKLYIDQQLDEWLDDDENLSKWEDNTLTASDCRILLACWFYVGFTLHASVHFREKQSANPHRVSYTRRVGVLRTPWGIALPSRLLRPGRTSPD